MFSLPIDLPERHFLGHHVFWPSGGKCSVFIFVSFHYPTTTPHPHAHHHFHSSGRPDEVAFLLSRELM